MDSPLLDKVLLLLESEEVKKTVETAVEAARFYYVDTVTSINLYPALAITGLLLLLFIPLLGSIPSIDLFPTISSPYGQTSGYGAPPASSGYGAPAQSSGYGAPARQSQWGGPGDYRSFQDDAGDDLRQLYNSNSWQPAPENSFVNVARSLNVDSPVSSLLVNSLKLLQ